LGFLSIFLEKPFNTTFLQNLFVLFFYSNRCGKRDTTQNKSRKKPICLEFFSTWTFCKIIFVVFLHPLLPRNAQKLTKEEDKKRKVGWWVGGSGI
jgi:hypothetical protein